VVRPVQVANTWAGTERCAPGEAGRDSSTSGPSTMSGYLQTRRPTDRAFSRTAGSTPATWGATFGTDVRREWFTDRHKDRIKTAGRISHVEVEEGDLPPPHPG